MLKLPTSLLKGLIGEVAETPRRLRPVPAASSSARTGFGLPQIVQYLCFGDRYPGGVRHRRDLSPSART